MRLIDADKMALDELNAYQNTFGEVDDLTDKVNYVVHTKIQMLIRDTPTAEAEPVRHGRWLKQTFYSIVGTDGNSTKPYVGIICSQCYNSGVTTNPSTGKTDYKYCPYCGAKMDGKENG